MAVTAKWYGNGLKALAGGLVDFDSDTIKVSLHTSTYTPDQDAHDFQDDLTNEVTSDSWRRPSAESGRKAAHGLSDRQYVV